MATAPVKPPLHNFPLSFLKWGSKNHTNTNHRYRRPVSAEPEPSDDSEQPPQRHHGNRVGSRTARHRFSLTSCSEKLPRSQNSEKESEDSDDDGKAAAATAAAAEEAEVQKPWNLRPRRAPAAMTSKANNTTTANGELHEPEGPNPNPNPKQGEQPAPKSMRLRGLAEGPSMEKKKEKRKFWIALSKDEIEEDIFIMTGSRPARRPKKRPKNVQKQLDNCFPGLWLVGFTADAYRGADSPTKK